MKKKKISISIDDWMREYLNFISKEYNISVSKSIRMIISLTSHDRTKSPCKYFDKDLDLLEYASNYIKNKSPEALHEALCFNGKRAWEYRKRKIPSSSKKKTGALIPF